MKTTRLTAALAVIFADYWEEAKDFAKMLEVTTAAAKSYPTVNPVEIAHARALQLSGRNRECVDYLKSVVILPSDPRPPTGLCAASRAASTTTRPTPSSTAASAASFSQASLPVIAARTN